MARYLVTGAAGFVGANLLRRLIGKGIMFAAHHPKDRLWRLEEIRKELTIISLDLADFAAVKKLVARARPDYIFHLAAYGTYPSQKDFRKIFNANTLGTANLLEALNPLPYNAFVMTGSSSEYGYKSKSMIESDVPEPNSFYSATKASATLIAQSFAIIEHKPIVMVRLFSIYGPWEEPGRLVPTVLLNAMHHNNIKTTAKSEVRDFVYIDDVIEALLTAAAKAHTVSGEIFNIGSGRQTKIAQVAKLAVSVTHSRSKIITGAYPARPWDAMSWRAHTHKSNTLLGWRARTSLKNGLMKMNEWLTAHETHYQ